ncbi:MULTISPECIES: LysR substrate-binding domain-containing protein [Sphingobium]|uniref:LysR family transcriptional regulator n=1 Tax=Sphingobium chungbukense TaxID=56193 RepID=A0A0M3AQ48_9SPHN|nr:MULTISPECIES: LysR substrate-binding domain-containing protein [Sphingobium]KKW92048.1 LysR family transcriptional regulator [Sphingobium chungbukense]PJG46256.1 LysR family transcriptional regulator [Sphingobium sp. LB126]
MDIRQLRYFLAVAAERNFSRAADRLHMAQPPLSRQIQQLEQEVGATLFDRDARPMTLTDAGRLFYEHAVQVTRRLEELKEAMRGFVNANRPRFVVGFVPSVLFARLPDIIRHFRKAAPDVDLNLVEMMSIEQMAALKEGRIDVGFGRLRFEDSAIEREVLREEELVAALPLAHRLLRNDGPIDLTALSDEAVIVYPREPRPSYADQVLSLLHDHGVAPAAVHEVRELQTALGLVAAEDGICIVPSSIHLMGRRDLAFRELAQRAVSPIIMSHRKDDHSPHLATMVGSVAAIYEEWSWPIPPGLKRHLPPE